LWGCALIARSPAYRVCCRPRVIWS
jgi:hypothetical protein